jgi:hypothetical protein
MKLHIRFLILLLTLSSANVFSEDNAATTLKPLDDYKALYEAKRDAIFAEVESMTELNFREKQAHYEQEVKALKREFKAKRAQDYTVGGTGSVTLTVEHSCKGRSSSAGGVKMPVNCGYKCVNQPNEKMFTKEEWVTVTDAIYSDLTISPSKACIQLKNDDTSLKKVTLTATFKYSEGNVGLKVAEDAEMLFEQ